MAKANKAGLVTKINDSYYLSDIFFATWPMNTIWPILIKRHI